MSKPDAFAQLGLTEEQFVAIYRTLSVDERLKLWSIFWKCNREETDESREPRFHRQNE